jgi:hypothetical protein
VGKLKPVKKATEAFLKRAAEIQADERLMDVARQHHYQHVTAPVGENAQPYQYGRHLEPAGMYTTPLPKLPDEVPEWAEVVFGKSDYKNPLVIPFGPENYDSRTNWKRELSRLYDGKSGKDLTDAIRADGYDAVVTVVAPKRSPKADKFPQYYPEEGRLGEVVDLYKGKGGVVMPSLAAGVGLGLAGQSEDADAVPIVKAGRRMIEAYHGSPHKFDKFSMENIGTGEGAQAYGHGLYFADSEDVARGYRDDLNSLYSKPHTLDGEEIPEWVVAEVDAGRAGKLRADFEGRIEDANQRLADPNAVQPWIIEQQKATAEKTLRQIDRLESGAAAEPPGALYRVHLDVDPDTLLDWDKPLREQPEDVRKGLDIFRDDLERVLEDAGYSPDLDALTGAELYEIVGRAQEFLPPLQVEMERALSPKEYASEFLKTYTGAPGIRYADGMSRGKDGGTYNYVMFDDKPISIQERGNVDPTLLAATGGASAIGLAASQFLQNRQQKQSQWESLRNDLLNTVTSVDRAIGKGFEALEMPWRGLLGLNRTVAGLLYGEGAQAVQEGARVAQQPVEQTAYDMGGVATDASGSPAVGAAVNTMVNLGGPI